MACEASLADGVPQQLQHINVKVLNEKANGTVEEQSQAQQVEEISKKECNVPYLVDFTENDARNPLNWPLRQKWMIQLLVALTRMMSHFGTIIIVPAVPQLLREFGVTNHLYSTILVSIWELGEGVGSFFVGPLSERFGRVPIFHSGNAFCIVFGVASALSTNISMLVAFRFFNGLANATLILGPSMVSDVFRLDDRGLGMAVAIAIPMLGPFCAPIVGGYVAASLGWRWTIWLVVIATAALSIVSLLVLKETYKVIILERIVRQVQKETGDKRWKSRYKAGANAREVAQSVVRPVKLLFSSLVVFLISLYAALIYGLSYLILTTLTLVLEENYGFSTQSAGLAFLGRAVGNVVGIVIYGVTSDRYLRHRKTQRGGKCIPEDRLPHMLLGSAMIPLGVLIYGWTSEFTVAWPVPIVATGVIGASMLLAILPTENYLADAFELHAASAIAASVVLRSVTAAAFPLVGPPLYEHLGLGWGNSVLALIFLIWIPVVAMMTVMGHKIRERSNRKLRENGRL